MDDNANMNNNNNSEQHEHEHDESECESHRGHVHTTLSFSMGLFSSMKGMPEQNPDPCDSHMNLMEDMEDADEQSVLLSKLEIEKCWLKRRRKQLVERNLKRVHNKKRYLLTCCETFFAILKSYITINIFFMPIAFKYGGWLMSPITVIIVFFFLIIGVIKLIQVCNQVKIYSYPDLVEYAFGWAAR